MVQCWKAPAVGLVIVLAVMALSTGGFAKKEAHAGKTVTITGEVVDLWCYLDHKARGQSHKACATACAKAGNPIGIVTAKGEVYLTFGGEKHTASRDQLIDHMADTVTVTGAVKREGGLKGIYIQELKVARAAR